MCNPPLENQYFGWPFLCFISINDLGIFLKQMIDRFYH